MRDVPSDRSTAELVGVDILGLITTGMYADPLAIYREYIQNAADSIDTSASLKTGRVDISIDTSERRIVIRDDGPGLTLPEAERALVPIGASQKPPGRCRGFRGIGKLVGLAFGDSVTFSTRSGRGAPVIRVVWNGVRLRCGVETGGTLEDTLGEATTVGTVDGGGAYPEKFFEVRVDGISRHSASSVMNEAIVRKYISEVCPVPFRDDFPCTAVFSSLFGGDNLLTLNIFVNGEGPIRRPHRGRMNLSESEDEAIEFEEIKIPGLENQEWCALGWIGHTSYRGAVAKGLGVRGIRARVGNVQIGDEGIFDHLFSEDRFNRWCMAEIHILGNGVVPNARRDYFEPNPHLRNLENQLGAVCRRLERRCRMASRGRLERRRCRDFVNQTEGFLEIASAGYLGSDAVKELVADRVLRTSIWRKKYEDADDDRLVDKLNALDEKLNGFQLNFRKELVFAGMDKAEIAAYREIFGILAEITPDPAAARRTIETILERVSDRHAARESAVGVKRYRSAR